MSNAATDMHAYAAPVAAMAAALAGGDERAFRAAMSAFDGQRDEEMITGVRKVTLGLQTALQRFQIDSHLIDLAQREVPDARLRLAHVLKLTDEGVHRTMDLIEQCAPLTEALLGAVRGLARRAPDGAPAQLVQQAESAARAMGERLSQVREAQCYQDLIGQIIHNVMHLVDELQRSLGELAQLADHGAQTARSGDTLRRGRGPVVPGIDHGEAVAGQQDVDALLGQLGM